MESSRVDVGKFHTFKNCKRPRSSMETFILISHLHDTPCLIDLLLLHSTNFYPSSIEMCMVNRLTQTGLFLSLLGFDFLSNYQNGSKRFCCRFSPCLWFSQSKTDFVVELGCFSVSLQFNTNLTIWLKACGSSVHNWNQAKFCQPQPFVLTSPRYTPQFWPCCFLNNIFTTFKGALHLLKTWNDLCISLQFQ